LSCFLCHKRKELTEWEDKVETILKTKFPEVEYFLEGFAEMVDFAILRKRILIQVDGDYLFKRPLMFSTAAGKGQAEVDARCNRRSMMEGWHMLRIHNIDIEDPEHLLNKVRRLATACDRVHEVYPWGAGSSYTFSNVFEKPAVGFFDGADLRRWLTLKVFGWLVVPVNL
jgi:very-short-patch-repair endonuclease